MQKDQSMVKEGIELQTYKKKKPVVMLSLENRGARPLHHRIYHRRSRVPNGGVRLVRCLDEKFLTTL
jgi:hypothetical protein